MNRHSPAPCGQDCSADMELSLELQTVRLLLALLLGLGTGLLYDLLRPMRRAAAAFPAALLDALFCLLAGTGLFVFAMGAGDGRLGQWELCAALMGFLAYLHALSPLILPVFEKIQSLLASGLALCKKSLKKFYYFLKFFFQKLHQCFIIKK